jgi:large subunit ribosomal protein L15
MTINKRKKNSRQRASWTHGWGEKKKHRGGGNRGGRGMAGTGKRADSKKPSIWKERYFGKLGFVNHRKEKITAQNVDYIERNLERLVAKKLVSKEGDYYIVDSKKLGFNKLLGKGKITKKFKIDVRYASKKAIAAVEKAGGKVNCEKREAEGKKEGV